MRYRSCYEKLMEVALKKAGLDPAFQFSDGNRYGYVIDFALPKEKILIECDGEKYHPLNNSHDKRRDVYFSRKGWKILRFRGKEIENSIDGCLEKIFNQVR